MYCHPLDLPDEVISAREKGELVIFAGSGVSCGGVSKLPLFKGLTDLIGSKVARTRVADRRDYDVVLGEWHSDLRDGIHRAAHEIISASAGPNDIHGLLLRIFPTRNQVRLVTTNYDRHFTTAANSLSLDLPHYRAPALPLGDDFHGIVYLHGNVEDRPERFVLTDADFGRAYLSQGWARTFLQSLYAKYCVLFIGYSHADTLVSYLARGISHGSRRRFALQKSGDTSRWKNLGVEVITYDETPPPDKHANLVVGVRRWIELNSYRPQDTRARLHQIIDSIEQPNLALGGEAANSTIQLSHDDEDFLKRTLRGSVAVGWFSDRARDLAWIRWLHLNGLIKRLDYEAPVDKDDGRAQRMHHQFVDWVTTTLINSYSGDAVETFALLGGRLGARGCESAARALLEDTTDAHVWASPHLSHWLLAIGHCSETALRHVFLPELITRCAKAGRSADAITLFSTLIRIEITYRREPTLGLGKRLIAVPMLPCQVHDLREAWDGMQTLRTPAFDVQLTERIVACLEELYSISATMEYRNEPIGGSRALVDEPRGRFDPHKSEEMLADILLELLRDRSAKRDGVNEDQMLRWLGSPTAGWARLGYFALRVDQTLSASRKMDLIVQHRLLYRDQWQLQNEPSKLVSVLWPSLDGHEKTVLLGAIEAGPTLDGKEFENDEKRIAAEKGFRDAFVYRLAKAHPEDETMKGAMERLQLSWNDDDEEQDDEQDGDDLWWQEATKDSEGARAAVLKTDPGTAVDNYLHFVQSKGSSQTREDVAAAIVAAANSDTTWAKGMVEALIARGTHLDDLWGNLMRGLELHVKNAEFRRWFLVDLPTKVKTSEWEYDDWNWWTYCIFRGRDSETLKSLTPEEWAALLDSSFTAWTAVKDLPRPEVEVETEKDAFGLAINHPIGRVVEFWVHYLDRLRQHDKTLPFEWPTGLNARIRESLELPVDRRLLALAIYAHFLSFLRYAVPVWTRQEVLARLSIAKHSTEGPAIWSTWLCFGRLSAELAKELPPFMEESCRELLALEQDVSNAFLSYVAVISTIPLRPTEVMRWLKSVLSHASTTQRAWWINEVARCVRDRPEDQQLEVWKEWAMPFLGGQSLLQISKEEFLSFVFWPISFGACSAEVFEILRKFTPPSQGETEVFHLIRSTGIATLRPDFTATYLRWLLETMQFETSGAYLLGDALEVIPITAENHTDLDVVAALLIKRGWPVGDQLLNRLRNPS